MNNSSSSSNNKIKILCIHGFRHNSELLKKSMEQVIRKMSKHNVEFDFYDSPIAYKEPLEVKPSDTNPSKTKRADATTGKSEDYRQWWSATRENVLKLEKYDTIDESLIHLKKKWEEERYDGLLGFSQGSVLVQIFAYQIQNKVIETYEPKFLVLVSTFAISDTTHKKNYANLLKYRTVVMTGSRDTLVGMGDTLALLQYIPNAYTIIHTGGHYFSTSSESCYMFKKFIDDLRKPIAASD